MVEARKEDPGADAEREPGGKNEFKLFFKTKPEKHQKYQKISNIELVALTD